MKVREPKDDPTDTALEQRFRLYFKGSPTDRRERLLRQLEEHTYITQLGQGVP